MANPSGFSGGRKWSICNDCKKCVGLCSWSHHLEPVEGWVADFVPEKGNRLASFCVHECPEFEREPKREYKPTNTRFEYFKNLIQGGRKDDKARM